MSETRNLVALLRERQGVSQLDFAAWLNKHLGRRYDKHQISRWESEREHLPRNLMEFLMAQWNESGNESGNELDDRPRRATIIAFAMQKGGVGKTTAAVNVAYALRDDQARVLLIDADSQSNASIYVGLTPNDILRFEAEQATLYHALLKEKPLAGMVQKTQVPRLDLVPSSISLANADVELATNPLAGGIESLKKCLAVVRNRYDFIIIDCAPNLGFITLAALTAAHLVMIPVETEPLALMGMGQLLLTVDSIQRRANPDLSVLGVLPTKFKARLTQDQASLTEMRATARGIRVFSPVPHSTLYPQSAGAGRITLSVGDVPGRAAFFEVAAAARAAAITLQG